MIVAVELIASNMTMVGLAAVIVEKILLMNSGINDFC